MVTTQKHAATGLPQTLNRFFRRGKADAIPRLLPPGRDAHRLGSGDNGLPPLGAAGALAATPRGGCAQGGLSAGQVQPK